MVDEIIKKLGLIPLPVEGGMHLRTYVSSFMTNENIAAGTAIYYLLTKDSFSHMHKLYGDEIYHFYLGDSVELVELLPDRTSKVTILGSDILNDEHVQYLVKSGNYQGLRLKDGGEFALLGTTMFPGYRDESYTHGDRNNLLEKYPDAKEYILKLTN